MKALKNVLAVISVIGVVGVLVLMNRWADPPTPPTAKERERAECIEKYWSENRYYIFKTKWPWDDSWKDEANLRCMLLGH